MSLYISRKTEFVQAPTPAKHGDWINMALNAAFVLALALLLGTLVWVTDNGADWRKTERMDAARPLVANRSDGVLCRGAVVLCHRNRIALPHAKSRVDISDRAAAAD